MAIRKVGPSGVPSYNGPSKQPASKSLRQLKDKVVSVVLSIVFPRTKKTKSKIGTEIDGNTEKVTGVALKTMYTERT